MNHRRMEIYLGVPPFEAKGEPLIDVWSPWGSVSTMRPWYLRGVGRITTHGVWLRLPFGRALTIARRARRDQSR